MTHCLPVRSRPFTLELERVRKASGITQKQAADSMGADRETWNRVVAGRGREGREPRPLFDTMAAMADALGLTFALVPVDEIPPDTAPAMVAVPPVPPVPPILGREHKPRRDPEPEPHPRSRSVMAWLRDRRRERRIHLDDMAARLGIGERRFSAYEHGKREPYFGDVVRYAEECGLSLALVEPEAVPLASLSPKEADAVRRLVVSYVDHCVREGKPIAAGLMDAAETLDTAA